MCHIVVKLAGHGPHGSIGGLQMRSLWVFFLLGTSLRILRRLAAGSVLALVCIVWAGGIVRSGILGKILPHRVVDLGEQRVKAMGHARCFDVSGRLEEGKRIGVDSNGGIILLR